MSSVTALLLAAAAIATADPLPTASPLAGDDAPRCPESTAIVEGLPAAELFDPHQPTPGRAIWCERFDEDGRSIREALYTDVWPSGAPRTTARFEADRLEGEVRILHDGGGLWVVSHYVAGRLDGPYAMYHPNGQLWVESTFVDGVRHGRDVRYYPDGTLDAETQYEHGVEHGISRSWWPNGAPRHERRVLRGVWSGRATTFYRSARRESEGHYAPCRAEVPEELCGPAGAVRHGQWETWHPNGRRASRGQYRFGEKVGTWVYWDEDGQPDVVSVHRGDRYVQTIRGTRSQPPAAVSSAPLPPDPAGPDDARPAR